MPRDIVTIRRRGAFFVVPPPSSISFVQITKGSWGTGVASFAVSFDTGIAPGSIIVLTANTQNAGPIVSTASNDKGDAVTDSGIGVFLTSSGTGLFCQAFLTPTAGALTVTLTFTGGSPTFGGLVIYEVAGGVTVFDKIASAQGTATLTDSGSTGTLTSANEVAFCYSTAGSSNATPGSGWSAGQGSHVGVNTGDGQFGGSGDLPEHRLITSTAAINGQTTQASSASYGNICATIR